MVLAIKRGALAIMVATALGAQVSAPTPIPSAQSAAVDPLHQAGRNVTISLLTMGTGKQVWEMFGHNALWIHDNVTGRDTVFNWGAFDFNAPNFIPRFLKGEMLYAMAGDSLQWIRIAYRYLNRSVTAQELDLTASEKDSVLKQIAWYGQPENVNYRYNYFLDNCSTRIRDILDNVLHGQLRAQAGGLTGTTYRWHTLRLMQGDKLLVVGVDIGMGRPGDRELTKWQEMFLPQKLHDFVGALQVRDSAGGTRPLVRSQQLLFRATRPPEADSPPNLWPWLLGIGLIVGGLFVWLGSRAANGGRWIRRGAAIVIGAWAAAAGVLGLLLTLMWTVTDHVAAYSNESLLLFNPFWLMLVGPLVGALWTGRESPWARRLATITAALSILALVAHVVRLSAQDNVALIGLALPPALAIAWVAVRRMRQTPV